MELDDEQCWRAVRGSDARFDGRFYSAVTTTGIYCRPSCPARPHREHLRFFRTAAAAQAAGFRACRRCRPDVVPGSPEWNARTDTVARAMRLVADGMVDRDGVEGLSVSLGYTPRHLHRLLVDELGIGPLALARTQRAHTARLLLETTELPVTEVAFAAGFASVRQFNDTVRQVYATTPRELRRRTGRGGHPDAGTLTLRLPYRRPFDVASTFAFLARRAVDGLEHAGETCYRRSLKLPYGAAVLTLAAADGYVSATVRLTDPRDLPAAVSRARRILDLDADPVAVDELLAADPKLAPLVAAVPGVRVHGCADPAEAAVRALAGQQVSVAAARTTIARIVASYGKPLAAPEGGVTHTFPSVETLAGADPGALGMPRARGRAIVALAEAVASRRLRLDAGADRRETERALLGLPGIGPWTAAYVAMRGLADPDAFPATDLGVRRGLERLGLPAESRGAEQHAERWRPWRSYAVMHLWGAQAASAPTREMTRDRQTRRQHR